MANCRCYELLPVETDVGLRAKSLLIYETERVAASAQNRRVVMHLCDILRKLWLAAACLQIGYQLFAKNEFEIKICIISGSHVTTFYYLLTCTTRSIKKYVSLGY